MKETRIQPKLTLKSDSKIFGTLKLGKTLMRSKRLILIIAFMYIASIAAGMITRYAGDERSVLFVEKIDQSSAQEVQKIFGRFRGPVRDGDIGIIALCSLIVFTINILGNFINHTLPGIFVIPIAVTLIFSGWTQGVSLGGIQASSFISLFLFLSMGCLEWITYVIASAAGVNIGLSLLVPKRRGLASRWEAFKLGWREAGRLYILIFIILAFQAVFEILYVRKVLIIGGSAIPLKPY